MGMGGQCVRRASAGARALALQASAVAGVRASGRARSARRGDAAGRGRSEVHRKRLRLGERLRVDKTCGLRKARNP